MKFLLAGLSVRALAQSAVRAGYRVAGVDYFGDRDLVDFVECRSLLRSQGTPYSARALPRLAAGMDYDALVYVSNLENHPAVVRKLAGDRPVFGNSPEVLEQVRHWPTLRRVCNEEGVLMPQTLFPGEEAKAAPDVAWLRKPVLSGGGHSIKGWGGLPCGPGWYLQARAPGVSASAVFVANGEKSVVLGLSEQLIGDDRLGAQGFRHCGNITPLAPELGGGRQLLNAVQDMVDRLTRRFGLRGVGGVDFMVTVDQDGIPRPTLLEVNPRPTSSAELIEESGIASIFDAHVKALAGVLPPWPPQRPVREYLAKGIVFAREPGVIPDAETWLLPGLCDVGHPGDSISPGKPICSIMARGTDRQATQESLFASARTLAQRLHGNGKKP